MGGLFFLMGLGWSMREKMVVMWIKFNEDLKVEVEKRVNV